MPLIHRVRPLSFARTAQILALALGLAPALTFAQQPRPYDDSAVPVSTAIAPEPWTDTIPAHLAVVDGEAWLDRDGDAQRADENIALLAGDRLRTIGGRVEVLFSDGSVLDIDRGSTVALLSESLVGLERGQIRLTLSRAARGVEYRIDGAGASAWIRSAGEYRVAVLDPETASPELRLTVIRGQAELASPHGRTLVQTGYEAVTSASTLPSLPYVVSVAVSDPFERWAYDRHAERIGVTSAQYLPEPMTHYSGVLDRYGSWAYERPYGYVWFPHVASTWRPYHDGRWSFSASFGWIWVGGNRWSWPTHHFGRWGFVSGRWFWIPNRQWGPAWVSWVHAPGFIGWCPLGFNNRPVISITNITVFNSHAWRGWTILPSRHFGRNVVVRQYAVTSATVLPPVTRFAAVRGPDRPASVRVAAARRPLGAPATASAVVSSRSSVAAGRAVAGPSSGSPSRSAAGRSATGLSRPPLAESSSRTPARAPAVRTTSPVERAGTATRSAAPRRATAGVGAIATSQTEDSQDREVGLARGRASRGVATGGTGDVERAGTAMRSGAPRRAAAGAGAIASEGENRGDREVGLARSRTSRGAIIGGADDAERGRAGSEPDRPAPARAAPRRAAPQSSWAPAGSAPAASDVAPRRAEPAARSESSRPLSVWSPPASRGAASRRAEPRGAVEPPSSRPAPDPAPAPAWRSRGRSEAPAASAPPPSPPPSRSAEPAPSGGDSSPSRSRAGSRSEGGSGGESSGARRRAGSRP